MAQIKDLVKNPYKCGTIELNEEYYLFIEELEPVDNEEDILIELHAYPTSPTCDSFCCNCLDYKGHQFTTETDIEDVKTYALEVIGRYEHDN